MRLLFFSYMWNQSNNKIHINFIQWAIQRSIQAAMNPTLLNNKQHFYSSYLARIALINTNFEEILRVVFKTTPKLHQNYTSRSLCSFAKSTRNLTFLHIGKTARLGRVGISILLFNHPRPHPQNKNYIKEQKWEILH